MIKKKSLTVIRTTKINKTIFRLVKGDITERNVDAIVSAHSRMFPSQMETINKKRGKIIQKEIDKMGIILTGSALLLKPGKLTCKSIIHAVGPQEIEEFGKLKNTIQNVLKLATQMKFKSISIPSISFGIGGGLPGERSQIPIVENAIKFLKNNPTSLEMVEFCVCNKTLLMYYRPAIRFGLKREFPNNP